MKRLVKLITPFSDTKAFCGLACNYVCPVVSLGGAVVFTITSCVAWNLVLSRKMCSIVKNSNFLDLTFCSPTV